MMGNERRSIGSIILMITIIIMVGIKGSSAQKSVNDTCLVTMGTCLRESSSLLECCPIIKDAILEERECFCLTKQIFGRNATLARTWSNILIFCSVTASFDSLCPDSNSSFVLPPSSSPDSPPSISPTESPVSPPTGVPTPSSPVENLFPPTPGPPIPTELLFPPTPEQPATDNDTGNGSGDENDDSNAKKIGYPMVLVSSSALLLIWAILLS
ncbi:uncharacterized protein LOC110692893 [Chenopodium quinoa]|uniref:uncharacterized protein LOC110692893 n=1 Tax=Chenopodium quinoa TaxID=63459 RepID=UPI000B788958|nr:uncharacterized protein LOC110692893 [Chenopodium quinoa]